MELEVLQKLGVALLLSSLIGLEREKKIQERRRDGFGGLRTFALIGLFGALSYLLAEYSIVYFAVLTSGFLGLVIAMYVMSARKQENIGATSEIASILVYIIGILSARGMFLMATSIALAVLLILYFKKPLHKWASRLEQRELLSTIEFIIVAFVILPILPNQSFGPYDFFNPYLIWLMVVFISGLSFLSYVAIKVFGTKRGIVLTGFLAGFISSTALTLTYSADSKKNRQVVNPYVIAIVIAGSAMFFRVLIEVAVIYPDLLSKLLIPILSMGIVGILSIIYFWFGKEESESKRVEKSALEVKSPFSLIPALKFGLLFALILFLTKFAHVFMGDKGIYLTSFVSGVVDVDAITLSIANLAKEGLAQSTAVIAITIAAIVNTLTKGLIILTLGNKKVGIRVFASFGLIVGVGLISLIFV